MADSLHFPKPVVILGGGLVGLTLAQALKKHDIPAICYEQNDTLDIDGGWAVTIHWAMNALEYCLPTELFERLQYCQVDQVLAERDDGKFLFLDLKTALPKYSIQPSRRMRINRRRLRLLLSEGLDVRLSKQVKSLTAPADSTSVVVHFADGTTAESSLVVACDGTNSKIRHLLFQQEDREQAANLQPLPVRALGVTVRLTAEQIKPLRAIDPLLAQGSYPGSNVFLWYSLLSTPEDNESAASGHALFEVQIVMSWLHKSAIDDVPKDQEERRQKLRTMAEPFETRLRSAVFTIPRGAEIKEIRLADWPTQKWPSHNGRVVLAGDSCHAMTMYRGEAFNHGITDVMCLVQELVRAQDSPSIRQAMQTYQDEVVKRTHDAVLLSRQACLDAHDILSLGPDSPVVSKRAKVLTPATAVAATMVGDQS